MGGLLFVTLPVAYNQFTHNSKYFYLIITDHVFQCNFSAISLKKSIANIPECKNKLLAANGAHIEFWIFFSKF